MTQPRDRGDKSFEDMTVNECKRRVEEVMANALRPLIASYEPLPAHVYDLPQRPHIDERAESSVESCSVVYVSDMVLRRSVTPAVRAEPQEDVYARIRRIDALIDAGDLDPNGWESPSVVSDEEELGDCGDRISGSPMTAMRRPKRWTTEL